MTIISDHDKTIYRQAASEAILSHLDQRDFNPQLFDALQQLDSANDTCGVFITLKQSGHCVAALGALPAMTLYIEPFQNTPSMRPFMILGFQRLLKMNLIKQMSTYRY